jgi:RNA polymerase subunit RPABC4/transcription elongation factor Spt4
MAIFKEVGGFVGTTKLNRQVAQEEEKVEKLENEIGRLIYQKFVRGETLDLEFSGPCQEIGKLQEGIEVFREKIRQLKGIKKCPSCANEIDEDQTFCSKCGAKQAESIKTVIPETKGKKTCAGCKAEIGEDLSFCPKCGAKQTT